MVRCGQINAQSEYVPQTVSYYLFQPKCTNLCRSTEWSDNAIRLLKTDLNSSICLLEIDMATFFKIPQRFVWKFKTYNEHFVDHLKTDLNILKCVLIGGIWQELHTNELRVAALFSVYCKRAQSRVGDLYRCACAGRLGHFKYSHRKDHLLRTHIT